MFFKILLTLSLLLVIYWLLDGWTDTINIYASSCETSSGYSLPMDFCKKIVQYRYWKDN